MAQFGSAFSAFCVATMARTAAALAKRNYERAQSLLDLKAASALQVDQARQDQVVADSAVKNAQIEVARTTDVLEDDLRVPVSTIQWVSTGYLLALGVTIPKNE